MRNERKHNIIKKLFGLFKHGAGGVTLGLGSSSLILGVTTAVALVAVATTAWLTTNRNVDSGSAAMDVNTKLFELGVRSADKQHITDENWTLEKSRVKVGNQIILYNDRNTALTGIINEADLNRLAPAGGYDTGASVLTTDETETAGQGVVCRLQIDDGEPTMAPGTTGTLTFLIYPKKNDLSFSARLTLSALGKKLITEENGETSVVLERLTDPVPDTDSRADAFRYLKGHIIFFTGRSAEKTEKIHAQDEKSYYSYADADWIAPGSEFLISGADKNRSGGYTVTLYWEWPVTQERLEMLAGYTTLGHLHMPSDEIGAASENADLYYHYHTVKDANNNVVKVIDADSNGYNNADTEIGKHISHILADITVNVSTEESDGPTATVSAAPA